jgi:hypothetical protein
LSPAFVTKDGFLHLFSFHRETELLTDVEVEEMRNRIISLVPVTAGKTPSLVELFGLMAEGRAFSLCGLPTARSDPREDKAAS